MTVGHENIFCFSWVGVVVESDLFLPLFYFAISKYFKGSSL
jgi:hypothetical protein